MPKNLKPSQMVPWVRERADNAFSVFLQKQQGAYSAAAPVATGRLASSFRIGKTQPDLSVEPPREGPEGVTLKEYSGRITMDGTWRISNDLIYAQRVAYDPRWSKGGKGGSSWFTTVLSQRRAKLDEELKREFSGQ